MDFEQEHKPKNFKTQKINIRSKLEHCSQTSHTLFLCFHLKLKVYSLISNHTSHAILSSQIVFSPMAQTRALSLLSWLIHLMAKYPWPNPMVEEPKTHGRNPRLTKMSSSLSLSLSKVLSLVRIV